MRSFHSLTEEVRILGDSTPSTGASLCVRVEGFLVSDVSRSISFIYAEVCQIDYLLV